MLQNTLQVGLRFPRACAIVILFVSVIAAFGLPKLRFDTSIDSLIDAHSPATQYYNQAVKEFGSDTTSLVYLQHDNLFTPKAANEFRQLHHDLDRLDFTDKVVSIVNIPNLRSDNHKVRVGPILDHEHTNMNDLATAKSDALYNPILNKNFVSADGNVLAMTFTTHEEQMNDPDAYFKIEKLLQPLRKDWNHVFHLGPQRIDNDLNRALIKDMAMLGALSLAALMASIYAFLRSKTGLLLPITTASVSLLWTYGFMGHFGVPINVLTGMLPTLLISVGATEDIHMFTSYLMGIQNPKNENNPKLAVKYMLLHVGAPLIMTTVTTFIGFFSNALSDIQLLKDFAYASSMAFLFNGVITLVLVPLLLSKFGPKKTKVKMDHNSDNPMVKAIAGVLSNLSFHHARKVMVCGIALMCVFAYYSTKIHVSLAPISYFKKSHPIVEHTKLTNENLAGTELFYIILESKTPNAFKKPANLQKLANVGDFIKQQGKFGKSISIADQLALINRELHDASPDMYHVPYTEDVAQDYYNLIGTDQLSPYLSSDFKSANVIVRHSLNDSFTLKAAMQELKDAMPGLVGSNLTYKISGRALLINDAADNLMVNQIEALSIVLIVVFILISALFSTSRAGLLSLIPNLVPIFAIFGFMGMFNIPLNPGTVMVAVISIGIAVDDTVHLFSKYNQNCRRIGDQLEAVKVTLENEALPVISTSLALAAGFLVLMFSNFTIISDFGMLTAIAMLFAMLSDLLITPILLSKVRLVSLWDILSLHVQKETIQKSILFADMTPFMIRKAILLCDAEDHKAGEVIIQQGDHDRKMYLILSGEAEVYHTDQGKAVALKKLEQGEIFGEIAYANEIERTASVKALTDCELVIFNHDSLEKNIRKYPRIALQLSININRILGERLAETNLAVTHS